MQSSLLVPDLSNFDDAETGRAILADEVLGDVTRHLLLEDKEVLVLLKDLDWVLNESIAQLGSAVAADEVEVEGLAGLVF